MKTRRMMVLTGEGKGSLTRCGSHLTLLLHYLTFSFQVADEIKQLEVDDEVVRFSVTGYSLGGLVARYLVG